MSNGNFDSNLTCEFQNSIFYLLKKIIINDFRCDPSNWISFSDIAFKA